MIVRAARLVTTALVVGLGLSQVILTIGDWHLRDMGAYWEAAMRLREGEPLYPPLVDTEASDVYRYAPWFAWAWVPLTHLPREIVNVLWSGVLLAASGLALVPLARARAWLLVAFFAPILVGITAIGNVQPLIVAALVLGVERRTGPLWIAMTASLKAVPILFIATYLGRREWARAGLAVVLTAILVGPMLIYGLEHYPSGAGEAAMLLTWPFAYALVVGLGIVASLRLARSRFAWLGSSTAVCLAAPRFFVYDITFLMAAIPSTQTRDVHMDNTAGSGP